MPYESTGCAHYSGTWPPLSDMRAQAFGDRQDHPSSRCEVEACGLSRSLCRGQAHIDRESAKSGRALVAYEIEELILV